MGIAELSSNTLVSFLDLYFTEEASIFNRAGNIGQLLLITVFDFIFLLSAPAISEVM